MMIRNGYIVHLINQKGSAAELEKVLPDNVKVNVIEIGERRLQLMIPDSTTFTEQLGNSLVATGPFQVSQMISAKGELYVYYTKDDFRSQVKEDNQRLAGDLFNPGRH
ncbi:hypothetical protein JOAD_109 [Erwinia phage vB_EamM_Joad]|uniref:Uncharacterized protein n=1 Tax=Erwinia phage vB_EamM_Joad TaxID=2026081 RepID=A0A223LJQ6_9CAUD|nr:hypothetical protein JOAD_109 [Erwinia phage vB_EamM_Joad]